MWLLNTVYVIVAVLLLFGAAVFVHEYGHYWMALRRGLKIEGFSIGFGPKIVSWMRDGVEWSWRWIPAGGFVKLPQMTTSDALEGKAEETATPLPPASPSAKILVAFSGPLMNVVFGVVIAFFLWGVGIPIEVNPPIIGYVEPGSREAKLGIQAGDVIQSVDGKQVTAWHDVQETTMLARSTNLPVVIARPGKTTNTYELHTVVSEALGLKMLDLDPRDHPVIKRVLSKSPAEAAGLQAGDEVLMFAQVPLFGRDQFISLIGKCAGQTKDIVIKRNGQRLTLKITPRFDPALKAGRVGVEVGSGNPVYRVEHLTPWAQISIVLERTVSTFSALAHSKQTGVGLKDLSGPPGILTLLAYYVNTDWRLALSFLVLLNINLAIINLLPIPVLDGGHIVMALVERLFGRALPHRLVEYVTTAFAFLLIGFMLYVSWNDVQRWSLFRSMFKQQVTIEKQQAAPAAGTN
jgi:regulator of sigma E protease